MRDMTLEELTEWEKQQGRRRSESELICACIEAKGSIRRSVAYSESALRNKEEQLRQLDSNIQFLKSIETEKAGG